MPAKKRKAEDGKAVKADEKEPQGEGNVYTHAVTITCPEDWKQDHAVKEAEVLKSRLKADGTKFIFQLERGENAGKLHFQCFMNHKIKKRNITVVNEIAFYLGINEKYVHARPASQNGQMALKKYCMKKDTTYVAGPWFDGEEPEKEYDGKDVMEIEKSPFPWQKFILEEIEKEPNKRTVNWIVDEGGCSGKTTLAKYLGWKKKALYITFGKAGDLINFVYKRRAMNTYFLDLSRTKPKDAYMEDIYAAIESVKNGIIVNTKYETGDKYFAPPHVWVFANMAPNMSALTPDRWALWTIEDKKIVPYKEKPEDIGEAEEGHPKKK